MRSKKGFTLIELLAVIVILAIIALIAVPIVLNIINNSRKSAAERSAENYLTAVEQAVAKQALKDTNTNLDGNYTISSGGKTIIKDGKSISVSFNGKGLTKGTLVISKGKVTGLTGGIIDNYDVTLQNGKITLNEILSSSTLLTGKEFNVAIKNFGEGSNNYTTDSFNDQDPLQGPHDSAVISSIEFYSNGNLPNGYTKEKLTKLSSIDVSKSKDKSIMAYKETTSDGNVKIYVYSSNQIITNKDSSYMFFAFHGMSSLNVSQLKTNNTTNMNNMFHYCTALTSLNVSNFDTSNVTDMSYMFNTLPLISSLDLSNFNTSKVTNMVYMLSSLGAVEELDLSNFDTSNVTNMEGMLSSSESLTKLNLTSFNTSKVTNMNYMFGNCSQITSLDLSNFDTSNVTTMNSMFMNASNLKSIIVSNKWSLNNSADIDGMFDGCGTTGVTVK